MALHERVRVPDDHILHLKVPNVPKGAEVEVLVLSSTGESRAEKLARLAKAANDPLYQRDINNIADDFRNSDSEQI